MISYIAAFFGITGAILLAFEFPWPYLGWLLYAAASGIWIYVGLTSELYALVITSVFYIIVESTGFIKALRKHFNKNKSHKS